MMLCNYNKGRNIGKLAGRVIFIQKVNAQITMVGLLRRDSVKIYFYIYHKHIDDLEIIMAYLELSRKLDGIKVDTGPVLYNTLHDIFGQHNLSPMRRRVAVSRRPIDKLTKIIRSTGRRMGYHLQRLAVINSYLDPGPPKYQLRVGVVLF